MSDPVARLTAAQVMRRERVVELQWMASIRLGAVLAALCIFGGCGSDGVETATTPVAWQLDDAPILSIGEQDSGFAGDLYGIRGVARLGSGRIIVADRAQRLVVFDRDGAYLTTHGREGEGPGEFRSITWILRLPGDSLLIYDSRLRRASILTPDGELLEMAMDAPQPLLLGRFADGTLLGMLLAQNRGGRGCASSGPCSAPIQSAAQHPRHPCDCAWFRVFLRPDPSRDFCWNGPEGDPHRGRCPRGVRGNWRPF